MRAINLKAHRCLREFLQSKRPHMTEIPFAYCRVVCSGRLVAWVQVRRPLLVIASCVLFAQVLFGTIMPVSTLRISLNDPRIVLRFHSPSFYNVGRGEEVQPPLSPRLEAKNAICMPRLPSYDPLRLANGRWRRFDVGNTL
jgi:hypothetical protein